MPLSNDSARKTAPCQPDNNLDVDSTAQLQLIDLGRLHQGDGGEAAKLFKAAKEDGVFYVDLRDQPFMGMIDTVDDIFALSKELFSLSKEEKMEYGIDELGALKLNGYKPVGRNFGGKNLSTLPLMFREVTLPGVNCQRDGFESYTVPGKVHVGFSFPRPPLLARRLSSLTTFFAQAHQILNLLLLSLSSSLQLPPTTSLTNLHRSDAPSLDILRLLHYIAQPPSETGAPQAPHTDLGSLTLLFAKSPGFQVMPPNGTKWKFVVPTTGCAIVNIGDGLTMLTGGILHPCLHRVSPCPGRAMEERYSLAYLQRAEDNVKMEALPGIANGTRTGSEVHTSREWLEKKFGMLRLKTWTEGTEGQKILTGRADVPSV